ncbi:unnamed protein product [Spirodela intermedia]|uniref:Uncharacterized protein n=1 Tax=Spirodela intermedia TaxID=51605 RepID=A0A7I8ITZ8_SPIIN|nr:unnamed protein product [Spirodela intermedia]CAA6661296.1 unnamed protein product [Spirodela intermedia]
MNHCAVQQSAMAAYEEMRRPFVSIVSDRRDPIFCPKPGRLSRFVAAADAIRPLRWHLGPQTEPCDSKPGSEVLDIILTKVPWWVRRRRTSAAPRRADRLTPSPSTPASARPAAPPLTLLPTPAAATAVSGGAARTAAGCVRAKFGPVPAAVRIEGFDCIDSDGHRRSRGIAAVA